MRERKQVHETVNKGLHTKRCRRGTPIVLGLVVVLVLLTLAAPRPADAGFLDSFRAVKISVMRGVESSLGSLFYSILYARQDTQLAAASFAMVDRDGSHAKALAEAHSPAPQSIAQTDERTETPPPEKEITRVREVVEKREVVFPADLSSLKSSLLGEIASSGLTLRNYVDAGVNDVRARIASFSGREDSQNRMISLTNKIDQLNEIVVTNGLTLKWSGLSRQYLWIT